MNFSDRAKQQRVLFRHFFFRLSYNELLKFENQGRESRIVLLVMLALAGLLLANAVYEPFLLFGMSSLTAADLWRFEALLVAFSMAVAGIIAVASWEKLFLDRLDRLNLLPLPLGVGQFFSSKALSLLAFVFAVTLAGNIFPVLIATAYPFSMLGSIAAGPAHFVAALLGSLFVALSVALLQGLILLLFPGRFGRSVAVFVQALLLVAFMLVIFGFPLLQHNLPDLKAAGSPVFGWFPPLWFTGVFNRLVGVSDPDFNSAGAVGLSALVMVLTAYLVVSRLCLRKFLAVDRGETLARARKKRFQAPRRFFAALFLRHPLQRAIFAFFMQTLNRSREHKLRLTLFLALPLGILFSQMVFGGWRRDAGPGFLEALLVVLPLDIHLFLLLGLRQAITFPLMLPANFVFRVSEVRELRHYQAGLRKALIASAILPPLLIFLPIFLFCWQWRLAALHALFCLMIALLLLEACFFGFRRVPFAAEHAPGKWKLRYYWPALLMGGYLYHSFLTALGRSLLRMPGNYPVFFAFISLLYALLRIEQRQRLRGERLVFEEDPEPAMLSLGLD